MKPVVKGMDGLVCGLRWGEPFWGEMIEDGILVYEKDDTSDGLNALVAGVEAE